MLLKFRLHTEKLTLNLFLGPGLSWTSPLRDIKILSTHVAIDTFTARIRKDSTEKYILFLQVLRFNVSSIKKIKKNVNLISL